MTTTMKGQIMDDEIRENLKEVSKQVQGVGRMIGSNKTGLERLTSMSDCLGMHKETLDIYIRILKDKN